MELQQSQLEDLGRWLSGTEEKINSYGPIGPTLDLVKKQVKVGSPQIAINQNHLMPQHGQPHPQICREGGFSGPALASGDGDDLWTGFLGGIDNQFEVVL